MPQNRGRLLPGQAGLEWWYIHVVAPGLHLTVVCHLTDIAGRRADSPYLSATMLTSAAGVEHVRADIRLDISAQGDLKLGSYAVEDRRGWVLRIPFPGVWVDVEIWRIGPPWRTVDSLIFEREGHSLHWTVPMPYASAVVTTRRNRQIVRVDGWAYQDHNWGAGNIFRWLRGWHWKSAAGRCGAQIEARTEWLDNADHLLTARFDARGEQTDGMGHGVIAESDGIQAMKVRDYMLDDGLGVRYQRHGLAGDVGGCAHLGVAEHTWLLDASG
jgi:hypothetical protein